MSAGAAPAQRRGRRRALITQADMARVFRAAKAEKVLVRIELRPDGALVIEQIGEEAAPAPLAQKPRVVL